MPDLPAPGDVRGACNKAVPLLPFYFIKALVLLALGKHPNQR
jgi:hypothetical protein